MTIPGGCATTARICRQHGLTLFYHLLANGDAPAHRTLYGQRRESMRNWRCVQCGRIGKLPPWVDDDRDGWQQRIA